MPTWRHQKNNAVLLRGALPHAKGVIGMLKGHPSGSTNTTDSTGFQEQDRYFIQIIETMPRTLALRHPWDLFDSNLSINSLLLAAEDVHQQQTQLAVKKELTPDSGRRLSQGAFHTVRSFSNFGNRNNATSNTSKSTNKWGSLKSGARLAQSFTQAQPLRDINEKDSHPYPFHRVPMYILGEKSQSKSIRLSELNAEFIPVDYTDVRQVRNMKLF